MLKAILDWLFCFIMGIKTEKQRDKEKIKGMSEVELNAYLKELEGRVKK